MAISARKNGTVWVRWVTSFDVHRTRTRPATITLQRAHKITVCPKNTSSRLAWSAERTSFSSFISSLLCCKLGGGAVERFVVDPDRLCAAVRLVAREEVSADRDRRDHEEARENGRVV